MNKKTPKLRFKKFTDAWKQRKFGEFVERKSDSALSSTSIPSVEYENVESETGVLKKDIYVKTEFKKGVLFSDKDVLYGKLRPYLHNWLAPSFTGVAVGDWWVLSPKNCSKDFLYRLLQTLTFDEIANQTSGTKMPRADWNLVSSTAFYIPSSIEEQAKIGSLFNRIDSTITLQQRKLDKLISLNKAYLYQMFPQKGSHVPEIRFSEFTDDWKQLKLGSIAEKVTQKNSNLEINETFTNSAEQGIISQNDFFDHKVSSSDNIGKYYVVGKGDFVYNPRISSTAPVGPINRNRLERAGVVSPLYTVFRVKNVDPLFLEWYFKSSSWHLYMFINGDSGARSDRFAIKDPVFFSMPILVPSKEEQFKIGMFFEKLNGNISIQKRKLEKLKQLKSSYLNSMFI